MTYRCTVIKEWVRDIEADSEDEAKQYAEFLVEEYSEWSPPSDNTNTTAELIP